MIRRALLLNVGSSSLKWSVLEGADGRAVASGDEPPGEAGVERALASAGPVEAVGHRLVHGGELFSQPIVVDDRVRRDLDELVDLDPLHLLPALLALDAARRALPGVPHVAAFDTAFHATLPEAARVYAVPEAWAKELGARRYGFHGLSVEHAVLHVTEVLGGLPARLVVAHLGSGSSITAVRDGRSGDTTMGMTPLEGVIMATRAGSIDPGLVILAARRLGLDADGIEDALTYRSGLAALSGTSGDLREVRAAARSGSARARLALEALELSIRRALGAMIGSLGGLDALVFTGGIGEHDEELRRALTESLAFAGAGSKVPVLVVRSREDRSLHRAVRRALSPSLS